MSDSERTRLEQGAYFADMLQLPVGTHRFWYILRHRDSDAILDQSSFETYEESLEGARKALAKFNNSQRQHTHSGR